MKKLLAGLAALGLITTSLLTSLPVHAASANLLANPSAETSVNGTPTAWNADSWGTNNATFAYLNTGHTGSHSLQTKITSYSSGDAKWYPTDVKVSPSTSYTFSDWYESTSANSVDLVVTSTTGGVSYLWQGDLPASSTWKQDSFTFKTPANAAHITLYHYIQMVGQLTTDDASLVNNAVNAPTPPTVGISSPLANATLSGTVAVSANATDAVAVKSVQFKLDGANLGSAVTTAPYTLNWNTASVSNGTHSLTAVATDTNNLSTTSTAVSVKVANLAPVTAPTVSLSAPLPNATVSGAVTVSANANDNVGVANVQFKLDGVNLGAADTTAPYSVSWDTTKSSNGAHTLTAVATNTSNLSTTSSSVTVNVNNPTPPTVSLSAPTANSTVSGTTTITAAASDAQAISNVQFKLDGANLGSPVTTAPYSLSWDTTQVANGTHSLSAVATNSSNLSTTSTAVTVTVSNTTPPVVGQNGPNLIANPSFETSTNGTTPDSWFGSNWGTNTSTFTYLNTGHTGNHSVKVQTTAYTNGAANWYYNDVPVTAGATYQYTNWYQSNVDTEVDAEVVMSDGTTQYFWLGSVFANTNWTKFTTTFTPPAGAKSMAIYQLLAKVGYIVSDDYSMNTYTPVPFNRGMVSVSFDDGWTNQYQNANPVMKQLGLPATYNIISGSLTDQPDYMSGAQVKDLFANGNEIASHSVTHPDLTTVSAAQLQSEMADSQTTLQNLIGAPVTDFAYPYGAYNLNTITVGKQYYASQRTVNGGFNTKDNLDPTQLKIYEVDSNVSQATVQGWINGAIAQHAWLILVYHEIAVTPTDPTDSLYDTQPSDFTAEMNYLKSTGVAVETVHQALTEAQSQ